MGERQRQLKRIRRLVFYYEDGTIPRLANHEVHPELPKDSRLNYLYFTLPVCINFQRSSPAMWQAAFHTFEDPTTNYVFYPEKLAGTPIETVRASLTCHKLALQPVKHTAIWTRIASTLHQYYHDDPRSVIAEAGSDAMLLIQNLQGINRIRFPYLSGPKLSNYWPYILLQYTDVAFTNTQAISIIPDTHVIQSSIRLGMVPIGASSRMVERAWQELLDGSGLLPTQIHPVLWNWSRNKFMPAV